ncbi:hypothetical protein [Moorena sp. SIO3I6]|uniref:hypothetical protein n=1 Tax=Moorena sp. SIO3I6 TaxID=2607831 RepID=UPI0025EA1D5D|nr:hypothetical protein [Moorena sp. SIO3I6]
MRCTLQMEMARGRDGQMGRWPNGEMARWGDGQMKLMCSVVSAKNWIIFLGQDLETILKI